MIHAIDVIRKKRDGAELTTEEIRFVAEGAARQTIPEAQLAAWLMAAWIRGLSRREVADLTAAMRYSGEVFDHAGLGKPTVDKHSTGGVGDKTSFLVAPLAAAAGVAVPMISGRALGHTGGTLDKLESIPGYRTQLSLTEARAVIDLCGATIIGQTRNLVPADRVLYDLRDRTGTVESPWLICASIMSKKLAAGLNGLVLDVKTGSGAFLKDPKQSRFLAELMVETGERSGTRTAAVMTSMDQPLGRMAGNWIEIWESIELLRGERHPLSEDLRELSLVLAGWMIHLSGKAATADEGRAMAEARLEDGSGLRIFREMVAAQGGELKALDEPEKFHQPKFRREFVADRAGYFAFCDCELVGWAVQRLGAGREKAGEPVAAHAGLEMKVKLGNRIERGQVLAELFADEESRFAEPEALLRRALAIRDEAADVPALIGEVITAQ
ncbi:thymidine phosphorylase [Silvibacterium dinghuense]|uniref:thymidine phosphorylase n=1 Tax=Silvibacterium dinghuense TaxID=1560006 RepID=UPI001E509D5B|nr:thymidine phosphorylase [Silvibacterium dinghuense]